MGRWIQRSITAKEEENSTEHQEQIDTVIGGELCCRTEKVQRQLNVTGGLTNLWNGGRGGEK